MAQHAGLAFLYPPALFLFYLLREKYLWRFSYEQKIVNEINERILNALDQQIIPWKQSWKNGIMNQNAISGHTYSGSDVMPLRSRFPVTLKPSGSDVLVFNAVARAVAPSSPMSLK